jgi:hypothetical protein
MYCVIRIRIRYRVNQKNLSIEVKREIYLSNVEKEVGGF